jgi:hypothetical protein
MNENLGNANHFKYISILKDLLKGIYIEVNNKNKSLYNYIERG